MSFYFFHWHCASYTITALIVCIPNKKTVQSLSQVDFTDWQYKLNNILTHELCNDACTDINVDGLLDLQSAFPCKCTIPRPICMQPVVTIITTSEARFYSGTAEIIWLQFIFYCVVLKGRSCSSGRARLHHWLSCRQTWFPIFKRTQRTYNPINLLDLHDLD